MSYSAFSAEKFGKTLKLNFKITSTHLRTYHHQRLEFDNSNEDNQQSILNLVQTETRLHQLKISK